MSKFVYQLIGGQGLSAESFAVYASNYVAANTRAEKYVSENGFIAAVFTGEYEA